MLLNITYSCSVFFVNLIYQHGLIVGNITIAFSKKYTFPFSILSQFDMSTMSNSWEHYACILINITWSRSILNTMAQLSSYQTVIPLMVSILSATQFYMEIILPRATALSCRSCMVDINIAVIDVCISDMFSFRNVFNFAYVSSPLPIVGFL